MEYEQRRLAISEQVQVMVALREAIDSESELIDALRANGQNILIPPRERALATLTDVYEIIARCIKLVAIIQVDDDERPNEVWGDDSERIDYGPGEGTPPF